MSFGIKLKVWGDYAAFNRPEMKVERVSYDVMTPSAARGILEAIYWKPQMRWVIDRIHTLNPIQFAYVRRNEISSKIPIKGPSGVAVAMAGKAVDLGINVEQHRQQRAAMVLRDVSYGIEAHVELRRNGQAAPDNGKEAAKHLEMFKRRAVRGQYFHHPYLGTREFPAHFALVESFPSCHPDLQGERDLGFMLQDMVFIPNPKGKIVESSEGKRVDAQPRFFRPVMRDGSFDVPALRHAEERGQ